MKPTPRGWTFEVPQVASDWSELGAHYSQWFNALSMLFPHGERFFIHRVKVAAQRRDIPSTLQEQIDGFLCRLGEGISPRVFLRLAGGHLGGQLIFATFPWSS